MSENTEQAAEAVETKTRIRPDLARYVKTKSANGKRTHRTDDFVARTLVGKELAAIKTGAALLGVDTGKWDGLNNGQQRMLIGNAIRNRLNAKKEPLSEQAVTDVFGAPVDPYDAEAEAAKAAAAKAEKEAKAAAAEANEAATEVNEVAKGRRSKK